MPDVVQRTIEILESSQYRAELQKIQEREAALAEVRKTAGKEGVKAYNAVERAAVTGARNASKAWEKELGDLQNLIGGGLLASIPAVIAGMDEITERVDNIANAAATSGLGVKTVEALGQAVERDGGSIKDLESLFKQFGLRVAQAASGSSDASKAFKALGVSATDAKGNLRDADDVFHELVDKIAALPTPTEKASAAIQAFGEGAGPLLKSGLLDSKDALDKLEGAVTYFGVTAAPRAEQAASDWQTAMGNLKLVLEGTGASLLEKYGPTATDILEKFTLGLVAVRELGVIPLESASNLLVAVTKEMGAAWDAVRGHSLQIFKDEMVDVRKEYQQNKEQIDDDADAALERVKVFYEEQKAAKATGDAVGSATGEVTHYKVANQAAAAAAAKAAAEAKAEAAARVAQVNAINAAQDKQRENIEKTKAAFDKLHDAAIKGAADEAKKIELAAQAQRDELVAAARAAEIATDSADQRKKIEEELREALRAVNEGEVKDLKKTEEEKTKKAKEEAAKRKALMEDEYSNYADLAGGVSDLFEAMSESNVEAAKKGDLAAQKALLRQFYASQAAAEVEAGINTILAVSKASTVAPPPFNAIAMAAALASGVAQEVAIASESPPSFSDLPPTRLGGVNGRSTPAGTGASNDTFMAYRDPMIGIQMAVEDAMKRAMPAPAQTAPRSRIGPQLARTPVSRLLTRDVERATRGRITI